MESWFIADRDALKRYFGGGFRESALPAEEQIERVPKADMLRGLDEAARQTAKRGYRKGELSFELLGRIDPKKVRGASPWAERFLEHLQKVTSDGKR